MENSKKITPSFPDSKKEPEVTEEQLRKAREIIHLLAKTVSQIKIYPPDHSTVKAFRGELAEKLNEYLEKYWKLELDIREFSFEIQNQKVYEDLTPMKSLPFLFFKDGMQKLFFYKGLKEDQLQEFLELIKEYFELPPEEADIVSLMWEKDFAHIRYFAPDDYLETKIGVGKQPVEIQVDRKVFQKGTVELDPEDSAALGRGAVTTTVEKEEVSEEDDMIKKEANRIEISSLDERESRVLKSMLETNRRISAEEELYLLVIEMLRLEEDMDRFSATLRVMSHTHKEIIQTGNFYLASQLLNDLKEMHHSLSSSSPEKARLIDEFFTEAKNRDHLASLKDVLLKGGFTDFEPFFEYLDILKPHVVFLAELYEELKSPDFRRITLDYIREIGKEDYHELMDIADEERISLTKEVIAILGSMEDRKAVHLLANFIPYRNKSIKRAAVDSLGKVSDPVASKILLGFLDDEDEEIRISAAQNIRFFDDTLLKTFLQVVQDRDFKKKSPEEKQTLLNLLARNQTEEAFGCLEEMIRKTGFLARRRRIESSLCATKVLEALGTEKAMEVLRRGSRARNTKVRRACRLALERLSSSEAGTRRSG